MKKLGIWLVVPGQALVTVSTQDLLAQVFHVRLSAKEVGIVMPAYMLACMVAGPFFGRLADKVGPKKMAFITLPALVVVLALYTIATSLQALVLVRVLQGMVLAALGSNVILLTRSLVEQDQLSQSKLGGKFRAGTYLGVGLASPTGVWLGHTEIWTAVVVACAIISCVMIFIGVTWLQGNSLREVIRGVAKWVRSRNLRSLSLIEPMALKVALPGMGVFAAYFAVFTWYADFVGNTTWKAKIVLGLIPLVCGTTLMTWLPKMFVRKNFGYFPTMVGSAILMSFGILLINVFGQWPAQLVAGVLVGVGMAACSHSITEEALARVPKKKHGSAMAMVTLSLQGAAIIGVSLSSAIWSRFGGTAMWLCFISLQGVVLALLILLKLKLGPQLETKPEPQLEMKPPVVFVNISDAPCCLRERAAHAARRGNEALYREYVEKIRSAPSLDLPPWVKLTCQKEHLAFQVAILEKIKMQDPLVRGLFDSRSKSLQDELESLQSELKNLLVEQFGDQEDFFESEVNEFRILLGRGTSTPEEVGRLLQALTILREDFVLELELYVQLYPELKYELVA